MIGNLFWGNLNSSLGASFALVENFGNQQTPSLVLSQNFLQDTKFPLQILELDSNKSDSSNSTESSLRGRIVDSHEAIQTNESRVSATESRPIRGAKNRNQTSSSASADFLLESELRGSPPKSEKRQLLARRGSVAGGAALLRKEKGESKSKKIVGDSRIAKMDSSLTAFAQNDESVDCFYLATPNLSNDSIYLRITRDSTQITHESTTFKANLI